jgi:hypothetical protein
MSALPVGTVAQFETPFQILTLRVSDGPIVGVPKSRNGEGGVETIDLG